MLRLLSYISPAPKIWRRWIKPLRLSSIRARYSVLAAMFLAVLLVSALVAQSRVDSAFEHGIRHTRERAEVRQVLRVLTDDIWRAYNAFYEYMLVPDMVRVDVPLALEQASLRLDRLAKTEWLAENKNAQARFAGLKHNIAALSRDLTRLMALRVNSDELYPALGIMVEKMLPAYNDFYTASTLAMQQAEVREADPAQRQAYKTFAEARHSWILMVGAFRTYVAYRFGIFPGSPEDGMVEQASAIGLYGEMLDKQLRELEQFAHSGHLIRVQRQYRDEMQVLHRQWQKDYEAVAAIYNSERWRADVPILRHNVQPLFATLWEDLRGFDREVELYAAQDVTTLSNTAQSLSRTLWMLMLVAVIITGAKFGIIEYTLRRPIARVTAALRSEARGLEGKPLPVANSVETSDLVAAFADMREHVHARQQRLETILDNVAEGIVTFDSCGIVESVNQAAEKLFGYTGAEAVGRGVDVLIPPPTGDTRGDYLKRFMQDEIVRMIGHEGEVVGQHKDGTRFPMAFKASRIVLQGRELYTSLVADISERRALLDNLKSLAEHDGLTKLYNRSYFLGELARVVSRARRAEPGYALLYIDLDNFKYVNDTLGHIAGDRLLIEVAHILNKRVRRSDLLARLGGDEFTVLLYDVAPAQVLPVAESFRAALADYVFRNAGQRVDIGCSVGVAVITAETESAEIALTRADVACHIAKRGGRNRVHVYDVVDESDVATMSLDMGWSRRIKDAIAEDRFVLAYQPIVDVGTRVVASYEVLLRLRDENGRLVAPSGFLPSAERFGLAVEIDKWVVAHAIESLAVQRRRCPGLRYSINLSGQALSEPGMGKMIHDCVKKSGVDPAALMFEITETMAIADMSRAESLLSELKSLGCQIALDDFGAGLSSFAYLKELQVDVVKIDGRFVKSLARNPLDQAMVKAMNDIAHALGKQTVAEWVEDEETYLLLREYGVDFVQGYYFGRPDIRPPCAALQQPINPQA